MSGLKKLRLVRKKKEKQQVDFVNVLVDDLRNMATASEPYEIPYRGSKHLIISLFDIGVIKFGSFKLKSGIVSPIYFDLRVLVAHPQILNLVSQEIWSKIKRENLEFKQICGVPYTALFMATLISVNNGMPLIFKRKEKKSYGTGKLIEGEFSEGDTCLIIEDITTTGSSIIETAQELRKSGLEIKHAVVVVDRGQGAVDNLAQENIKLIPLLDLSKMLDTLLEESLINCTQFSEVEVFLRKTTEEITINTSISEEISKMSKSLTCPASRSLLAIVLKKKSNLCLSADLTDWRAVLNAVEILGEKLCLVKTHIDLYNIENYSECLEFRRKMGELSEKFEFLVMEDRKFGDIGATVVKQIVSKPFEISKWANFVTVHGLPGPGILQGIAETCPQMGIIIIAEMSSEGNFSTMYPQYKEEMEKMANNIQYSAVAGFVSQSKIGQIQNQIKIQDKGVTRRNQFLQFLQFTPGVGLKKGGDKLGQNYSTVEDSILKKGADIIIVGRGIIGQDQDKWLDIAEEFRERGWKSFTQRILQS